MKIQPSLYNAYHNCHRQAWLMYHQINGDQMNEFLYIGRLLSEDSFQRKRHEILLANLPAKVDIMESRNGELLIAEIKKSSKRLKTSILQLKYYLYLLEKKGHKISGEIKVPKERISQTIHLNKADVHFIQKSLAKVETLVKQSIPPPPKRTKSCPKCAYFEFCFS